MRLDLDSNYKYLTFNPYHVIPNLQSIVLIHESYNAILCRIAMASYLQVWEMVCINKGSRWVSTLTYKNQWRRILKLHGINNYNQQIVFFVTLCVYRFMTKIVLIDCLLVFLVSFSLLFKNTQLGDFYLKIFDCFNARHKTSFCRIIWQTLNFGLRYTVSFCCLLLW